MRVVYPTTPAQFFHLLRRQVIETLRKPLIVFTPKGLLRHPECISSVDDLANGSFHEILDDPAAPQNPQTLAFCSGRIYYDLIAERKKLQAPSVALIRIEQLFPLNRKKLKELIEKYRGFKECCWVQDEPANMGAWEYIRPQLEELLPEKQKVRYIGRARSAATAVGVHAVHHREHSEILQALFKQYELQVPHDQMGIRS
jgi:2-oxoglutarate dehydrogenase E1 component